MQGVFIRQENRSIPPDPLPSCFRTPEGKNFSPPRPRALTRRPNPMNRYRHGDGQTNTHMEQKTTGGRAHREADKDSRAHDRSRRGPAPRDPVAASYCLRPRPRVSSCRHRTAAAQPAEPAGAGMGRSVLSKGLFVYLNGLYNLDYFWRII